VGFWWESVVRVKFQKTVIEVEFSREFEEIFEQHYAMVYLDFQTQRQHDRYRVFFHNHERGCHSVANIKEVQSLRMRLARLRCIYSRCLY